MATTLKPVCLDLTYGKRPDGATILPFARGLEMAWDASYATISHTCVPTYIFLTVGSSGAAAKIAVAKKFRKYASLHDRADFRAVGLETLGAFGPSAKALLDEISLRIQSRRGRPGEQARLYRRIAAAIQIGNAACILEAHSRSH